MEIYFKFLKFYFQFFLLLVLVIFWENPKLDTTFIANFGANIGSPAIVFYSLQQLVLHLKFCKLFSIFFSYYWIFSCRNNFLKFLRKDITMELPPFILPNTGNMGLPICLFAYGTQGLGIAGSIASIIILFHFTLVF